MFDEDHLFALQEALRGRSFALLGVAASEGFTAHLFSSIRQLAQKADWDLLLYVKDQAPDQDFIDLLASLHDVDFIIVKGKLDEFMSKDGPYRSL